MSSHLKDRVILVTGAGGGIGGVVAIALAGQGAQVILLDKSIPKLEKIYDQIRAANAPEPILYPFDLAGANENDYLELAGRVDEKYGALHGLLHTAVEFPGFTPLVLQSTKDWGHVLNVNLNAPFLLTRVLLPVLQKAPHAAVLFTSDSSVRLPIAYSGAYGVSKIALEGMAKILAEELDAFGKISVNTVVPGPVASPVRRKAFPAEETSDYFALAELAQVYAYLLSELGTGFRGQVLDARSFYNQHLLCQKEKALP